MSVASAFPENMAERKSSGGSVAFSISVHSEICQLEEVWRDLEANGTSCVYQNFDWVRLAYQHLEIGNTPLILHGHNTSGSQFIIPLVVEKGPVKFVRWPGKNHANICSGIYSIGFLNTAGRQEMAEIVGAIKNAVNGVAVLRLGNQPALLGGYSNPMQQLPNHTSANLMFDIDLREGMDAVLDAGNGKRKRKLFRRQVKEANKLGGYELFSPETPAEIEASLADFFYHKSRRFKELGVKDVFEPQEVKEFVRALMLEPERDGVKLQRFFELKVGGKTRAMYGCSMFGDYCQAWVNSTTYDDFADFSPGEMVLYAMIEQLIAEGYQRFDLGVGAERYKRSWCKSIHPLFDVVMPLSPVAAPYVLAIKAKTKLKSKLRNDDRFWQPIKKFRKLTGGLI